MYLKMLGEGSWPPNPQGSSYIDLPFRKRMYKAYFETPVQFSAEVNSRLDKTKSDGAILYWQIQAGIIDYEDLVPEAKNALNYMSGWRRRSLPYGFFKKRSRYRNKGKMDTKR